ncbi:hypothetical protein Ciccas_010626 [Cichlidogyrus casuarinus]|uniref:Uncharacterized protein n=1 Tax=Cichlidogyrus casuarinus TaxID=1844966 RepID=A0ABD2PTM9_9PLAT
MPTSRCRKSQRMTAVPCANARTSRANFVETLRATDLSVPLLASNLLHYSDGSSHDYSPYYNQPGPNLRARNNGYNNQQQSRPRNNFPNMVNMSMNNVQQQRQPCQQCFTDLGPPIPQQNPMFTCTCQPQNSNNNNNNTNTNNWRPFPTLF